MITLHETLGGDFTEALNSEPQAVQSEAVGGGGSKEQRDGQVRVRGRGFSGENSALETGKAGLLLGCSDQ